MREEKTFAKGTGYQKMAIMFIVGCLFGYVYEVLWNFIAHLIEDGSFFFERRSGVIYGPFSVVYGFGAVLMTWLLVDRGLKWWQAFLRGAIVCGVCEYLCSLLQETFTGTTSWDYSAHFLNFQGRTSLQVMLIWGVTSVLFLFVVYPWVSKWVEKIPFQPASKILNFVVIFLVIDMFISLSAVLRMNLRHHDVPAYTPYGQFLDTVYPDEFMHWAYPNMVRVDKKE